MPRRPSKFTQAEITQTLKAAKAAGFTVRRLSIDQEGNLVVDTESGAQGTESHLDAELQEFEKRHGES